MRVRILDHCPVCNTAFNRRYQSAGKRKICCSKLCSAEFNRRTFHCRTCGKPFTAVQRQKNRDYCSWTCANPHPCLVCGKTMFGFPSYASSAEGRTRGQRKFCSRACANIYKICREKIGGYVTLGFVACFKRIGRLACERCGTDNIGHLCVHHRDRNRKHNVPSNLEVLCLNCHSDEHNGKSRLRTWEMERFHRIVTFPALTAHITDWALK